MNEFIEFYINMTEWILLTLIPPAAVLTLMSWRLARKWWPYRIPTVVASVNTIVGACATWLAITVIWRWRVGIAPEWFIPLTATAVVVLPIVTFLNTALLVYLDQRQEKQSRGGELGDVEGHWYTPPAKRR